MPLDGRPAPPGTEEALDVVRRWMDAYDDGRDDELLALAHDDVVLRPLRFQGRIEYRGLDGLRAWLEHVGPVRPSFAPCGVDALDDERVLVEGVMEDAGRVVGLFELRDGKVARAQTLVSDREVLEHLGLI